MTEVKDIWKSKPSGITYGYCSCGREVKEGQAFCPLCGQMLEWKKDECIHDSKS